MSNVRTEYYVYIYTLSFGLVAFMIWPTRGILLGKREGRMVRVGEWRTMGVLRTRIQRRGGERREGEESEGDRGKHTFRVLAKPSSALPRYNNPPSTKRLVKPHTPPYTTHNNHHQTQSTHNTSESINIRPPTETH